MQKLIFLILIRPFYCTIRGYPYFLNAHRVLPSINPEHRASTSTALDTKPEHRAGKKHRASSEHRASMCSEASLVPSCSLLDKCGCSLGSLLDFCSNELCSFGSCSICQAREQLTSSQQAFLEMGIVNYEKY